MAPVDVSALVAVPPVGAYSSTTSTNMIVREPASLTSAVDGPELLRRMIDRSTPPLDRAAHWWGEVAALASRRSGPGPWSWNVAIHGHLDRYCHRGADAIRRDYLGRAVRNLATAIHEAGLTQHVSDLDASVGGRQIVVPLLQRAARIAEMGMVDEMPADREVTDLTDLLLADLHAQRTMTGTALRDEVLNGVWENLGPQGNPVVEQPRPCKLDRPRMTEEESGRVGKAFAAIAALPTFGPNIKAIAEHVGIPRSTLYGCEVFMTARNTLAADKEKRKASRRGRHAGDSDFAHDERDE